ncbi:hypothetical protein [Jidongwangia harbinensis]|uniref:hypothetical protein n=1 Tax=Jidongwangia harbinensis TaxID=2878561 RepID=UPI001CD9A374|nr:hypothetical protein [Jidongwangia harbinensis]MCA2218131.1 hypothetical protein [Jidongwangia harbinensis]
MSTESDGDLPADLVRLRNAVACELHGQLALRAETIGLADVCGVADAVVRHVRHAFRIEWAPPWAEEQDDDGPLGSDAAVFHGSGLADPEVTGTADRYPIFDHGWH